MSRFRLRFPLPPSMDTLRARVRGRAGKRGVSTFSLTIETAAVMMWFVFMILGEKLVGDATSARRSVENSVQQSARVSGASYCQGSSGGSSTSGAFTATPSLSTGSIGAPDIGSLMTIIQMLGFGSQPTMPLFTQQFQSTTATAQVDNVKAAALLGGNQYSYNAQSQQACREKPLDKPGTQITAYRTSVYTTNIQGWSPN